ncbi:hypothetical protein [Cerasicoccus frondis]|uniref:hypothetical protein n=1 Tax=Cerasicoccus frondis TaxID=490090 RepID=UPI002852CC29|nr:hypothetical protein [Cerasicoccus frondis]
MSAFNQAKADTTPDETGAEIAPEDTNAPQNGTEFDALTTPEEIEAYLENARQPAPEEDELTDEDEAEFTDEGDDDEESEPDDLGEEPDDEEDETEEAEPDEDEEEAEEEEDDESEPEAEAENTSVRMRFRPKSDIDKRALELMKRNRDWGLEECLDYARKELGQDDSKDDDLPDDNSQKFESSESISQKIQELKAEKKRVLTEDLDVSRGLEIDDELDALRDQLTEAKNHESHAQQSKQEKAKREFDTQWSESEAKALGLYDFVNDPNSEGSKLMSKIDADLEANDDPLFNSADKPLKLAQMAAAELNIPPKSKRPKPASKPKPSAKRQAVAPLARGNARTQRKGKKAGLDQQIDGVKSMHDLERLNESLGIDY